MKTIITSKSTTIIPPTVQLFRIVDGSSQEIGLGVSQDICLYCHGAQFVCVPSFLSMAQSSRDTLHIQVLRGAGRASLCVMDWRSDNFFWGTALLSLADVRHHVKFIKSSTGLWKWCKYFFKCQKKMFLNCQNVDGILHRNKMYLLQHTPFSDRPVKYCAQKLLYPRIHQDKIIEKVSNNNLTETWGKSSVDVCFRNTTCQTHTFCPGGQKSNHANEWLWVSQKAFRCEQYYPSSQIAGWNGEGGGHWQ